MSSVPKMCEVVLGGTKVVVEEGTVIRDLLRSSFPEVGKDCLVVAALCNGILMSLSDKIKVDTKFTPVFANTSIGFDIYRRSLSLVLAAICDNIFPGRKLEVVLSCGKGVTYTLDGERLTDEEWQNIVSIMKAITGADNGMETFIKTDVIQIDEAIKYFIQTGRPEVADLIEQRSGSLFCAGKVKVSTIDLSHVKGMNQGREAYKTLFIDPMVYVFNEETAKIFNNYEICREAKGGHYSNIFCNYFMIALPNKEYAKPSDINTDDAEAFYNVIPSHLHNSLMRDYKITAPYRNKYMSELNKTISKLNRSSIEYAVGKLNNVSHTLPNPNYPNADPADKSFSITHYAELYMRQQLADICSLVTEKTRLILICGPSSSGKTTFSHRLAEAISMHSKFPKLPVVLGMDMYYKNQRDCPILKKVTLDDGTEKIVRDFEDPEALRIDLINKHLKELVDGKEVQMPFFDFAKGEYDDSKGKKVKLIGVHKGECPSPDGVPPVYPLPPSGCIIMEGIHGLNPRFSESVPDDEKLLIFIHPHTLIKLDPITPFRSTYDRLIRRSVRDARGRGYSIDTTISRWPSVRAGEVAYIFSTSKYGNYIFNSFHEEEFPALAGVYNAAVETETVETFQNDEELGPLKASLTTYMSYITQMIPTAMKEEVPKDSILREFIGGLIFGEPH